MGFPYCFYYFNSAHCNRNNSRKLLTIYSFPRGQCRHDRLKRAEIMLPVSIPTVTFPTEVCRVEWLHSIQTNARRRSRYHAMLSVRNGFPPLFYVTVAESWAQGRVNPSLFRSFYGLRESLGPHSTSPCVVCSSGLVAFPSPFLQLINNITSAIYVLHIVLFHFILHTFYSFILF